MTAPLASVLTLVRGRQRHLDRLLEGLTRQTCMEFDVVIASMQHPAPRVRGDLPIRIVEVAGDALPLAAARNAAARAARAAVLIFLDVDCIPSPTLVENYIEQVRASGRCLLGEVRYLPALPADSVDSYEALCSLGRRHPCRPPVPARGWIPEPEARALWGLSFALLASQYRAVGGMDERYVGYGGEETDFSQRLARAGVRFGWCGAAGALHQHHVVHTPPLDKFDDIVRNATLFRNSWGSWCMEAWIEQFVEIGLIDRYPCATDRTLEVIRRPCASEVAAARQGPEVRFA